MMDICWATIYMAQGSTRLLRSCSPAANMERDDASAATAAPATAAVVENAINWWHTQHQLTMPRIRDGVKGAM
jgi:hypothetical protein